MSAALAAAIGRNVRRVAADDRTTIVDVGSTSVRSHDGITVLVADRRISVTLGASDASGRSAIVVLANGSIRVSVIRAAVA